MEVILKENHGFLAEMKELRDSKASDLQQIQELTAQYHYYEMKGESQTKEILRLQLQLELFQRNFMTTMAPLKSEERLEAEDRVISSLTPDVEDKGEREVSGLSSIVCVCLLCECCCASLVSHV